MRLVFVFLLSIIFSFQAFADKDMGQPENVESVTILASSSLTLPMSEIALKYSREEAVDVNAVFESSSELLRKIEDGDPADIVITTSDKWIEVLKERGLVDPQSEVILAENRLALVASKKMKMIEGKNLEKLLDFIHSRTLIVIADPRTVTLGDLSQEMLKKVGKWGKFRKFVILAPTAAKTVDLIIKGETAGVIYATDAKLYKDGLNILGNIPTKLHSPAKYYAAVVVGNNMEEARDYLQYLASNPAKEILQNHGFMVK